MRVKRLVYWIADCLSDRPCYSIRDKTRRGCSAQRHARQDADDFGKPRKVVIEYRDAFDLMNQLTQEGGGEGLP